MSTLAIAAVLALAIDPACGAAQPGSDFATHLVAVATRESGRDPLAVNVNGPSGGTRRFETSDEAEAFARELIARKVSFDAGLMQISFSQWERHGLAPATVFDACRNMAAGAAHLAADVRAVWKLAHRRYNCGGTACGLAYAEDVERTAARLAPDLKTGPPVPPAPTPPPEEALHDALRVHPRPVNAKEKPP